MSFFIRKQRARRNADLLPTTRKLSDRAAPEQAKRRRRNEPNDRIPPPKRDDEITSEEEDDDDEENYDHARGVHHDDGSEDEETAQEARVRLAKEQISALRKKMEEDGGGEDVDDESVGAALNNAILVEEGKVLRRHVADKFVGEQLTSEIVVGGGKALKSPLTCLAVDPSGSTIYTATKAGVVCRHDTSTNTRIHKVLKDPPARSLAYSARAIAAATQSGIHLLDPATLETLHVFRTRDPMRLAMSKDTLFSAHKDRTVKVWNVPERAFVEALFGHQDAPTCVDTVLAAGNVRCVSGGGFDRSVRVWKLAEESQLVYNWDEDIIDVVFVLSPVLFLAGSCSGSIALFSFNRKKPVCVVKEAHGRDDNGVPRWITAIGGAIGTDLVASGSDSGHVKLWRVAAKSLDLLTSVSVGDGVVVRLMFVGDNQCFAAVSTETGGGRWSGRNGKKSRVVKIA